jgi:hypothetical protein
LPDAPSDFRAAIAEKSLVNESAEMLGAAAADELLAVAVPPDEPDDELDDELDELPQAATPMVAATARAATSGLRVRKCTCNLLCSLSWVTAASVAKVAGPGARPVTVVECEGRLKGPL